MISGWHAAWACPDTWPAAPVWFDLIAPPADCLGAGEVKGSPGLPFLTRIGAFDVDLALEGEVLLVRQTDQPGIIAGVSSELAKNGINISYMTVSRTGKGRDAIMAIGVDGRPAAEVLAAVGKVQGVQECTSFTEQKA